MSALKNIAIVIGLISLVTFCALFGSLPRFRKTPVGFINRLIWIRIPGLISSLDRICTGGRFQRFINRSSNYLMNENHPLVLVFYLSLVFLSQVTFIPSAWPRTTSFDHLMIGLAIIPPYVFTYKCVTSTASVITPSSHVHFMRQYPYDHILYYPGLTCSTCQHVKPARSKHCRICDVCVAKQDHHCIWVMNCLGKGNYHYFLLMLFSLGWMLFYAAMLTYRILGARLEQHYGARYAEMTWIDKLPAWSLAFAFDIRIGAVGLLAGATFPLAWGLLMYQIYLIWAGVTTNESFKWDDWNADIADGYVYMAEDPGMFMDESTDLAGDRWPKRARQRLVNRAFELSVKQNGGVRPEEPDWNRVDNAKGIDNVYDLGFAGNLRDALPWT